MDRQRWEYIWIESDVTHVHRRLFRRWPAHYDPQIAWADLAGQVVRTVLTHPVQGVLTTLDAYLEDARAGGWVPVEVPPVSISIPYRYYEEVRGQVEVPQSNPLLAAAGHRAHHAVVSRIPRIAVDSYDARSIVICKRPVER